MPTRFQQAQFQATHPHDLPLQEYHISYEHLFDNIDRFYRCTDARQQLIIGGFVFSLEQQRRTKEGQPLDPRRSRFH